MNNGYDDHDDDYISRSVDKRAAEAAQVLGERLIALRIEQLGEMDLPEALYEALMLAKRLTSNEALRRHRQYIGKLMRQIELEPIEAKLAEWDLSRSTEIARFHQLEIWRDRLLEDDNVLGELKREYPSLDMQHVRTLVRNARKQKEKGLTPKSSRVLFKYLKTL